MALINANIAAAVENAHARLANLIPKYMSSEIIEKFLG
jgi:hypothetical protein